MHNDMTQPASPWHRCPGCGCQYREDSKSACATGTCKPKPTFAGWLDAHQVLALVGHLLRQHEGKNICFVNQEDEGWSFMTRRNGVLQRWLLCAEGIAEYPL